MFPAPTYTNEWLTRQAREIGGCNADLLERCVYALTLLRHLAESGLPFVFKGGTSLLLHLNPVRRLSIDIDIERRKAARRATVRHSTAPATKADLIPPTPSAS